MIVFHIYLIKTAKAMRNKARFKMPQHTMFHAKIMQVECK